MPNQAQINNCSEAAERVFRLYHRHCVAENNDTLFNLLNAAHSLNDRLRLSMDIDFFGIDEFIALKALRNFFHHEQELVNQIKTIPIRPGMPILSDLAQMCLVPAGLVRRAIETERREENRPRIDAVLLWYGNVVDIYPCVFNYIVHVYEVLKGLEVPLGGDEVDHFVASYNFEEANMYSHFASGRIICRSGDAAEVLQEIYSQAG